MTIKFNFKTLVLLMCILLQVWIALSFAEVMAGNLAPGATYSEYNALSILCGRY